MKSLIILNIFSLLFISCLSKGSKNVSGESGPQDITISLLKISPPSVVIGPSQTTLFEAVGGNAPYEFSVSSGLGAVDQDGNYTSPAALGNNTIQVTDAGGNSAFAVVTVGSTLSISPTAKTIGTEESFTLSGVGGVAPYVFSIVSGGGSINSNTGVYTSGNNPETVSISIKDVNNETAYSSITIVNTLTITPSTVTVEDGTVFNFSSAGGAAPYSYQVYAGSGSINASGDYTAPGTAGNDVIRVTDANSNTVEANVVVVLGPNISAPTTNLAPEQVITLTNTEGKAPFVFTLESGTGSVDASTGVYTAPAIAGSAVIRSSDANGFFQEITLQTYNLKKMALGDNFSCMVHVQNDNTTSDFKCWGSKDYGAIGDENSYYGDAPGELGDNLPTIDFGTGNTPIGIYSSLHNHRCALFSNGKTKCWGNGGSGRLGISSQSNKGEFDNQMGTYLPFVQLGDGLTVDTVLSIDKRVSVGSEHTCVMIDPDSVKCFGQGAQGRAGYGNQTDNCVNSGTCGNNLNQLDLGAGKSIVQLVASYQHSCAILAPDNRVKCWGEGGSGRLGYGGTADKILTPSASDFIELGTGRTAKQIASGYQHTCALLDDNTIKCWGENNVGQLGIGIRNDQGDGAGEMGNNLQVADMGTVSFPISIHSKGHHTCAIFNNGGLKCWGYNNYGQLGLGSTATKGDGANEMGDNLPFINVGSGESVTAIDMSDRTTCVITSANELKCWGENAVGQLGVGHVNRVGNTGGTAQMGDNLVAVDLGTGKTPVKLMVSINSTCALLNDSTVKCWGSDDYGNLGLERNSYGDKTGETVAALTNINLGSGNYAKDIFAGRYHVCAILMNDSLKCFGYGNSGRLGLGDTENRGDGPPRDQGDGPSEMGHVLPFVNLGAGQSVANGDGWESNTCAVLNSGELKCWGDGANGRRGSEDQNDRGDGANEMGDNLVAVDLGAGRTAKKVETGNAFTCTIMDNNQIKCFGYNASGRLGIGNTDQKGHSPATALSTYGTVDIGTGRSAKDIKLGHEHACVLMDNDKVKCWGEGRLGQLGSEGTADLGDSSTELGNNLLEVDLGTGRTVKQIAAGIYHSCALLDNSKIKCWGYGSYGQLGNGLGTQIGDAAGEMGNAMTSVILPSGDKPVSIYAAGYHTCAVMQSNDIKCWGRNQAGQLGHQHVFNVGTDALSMGNNLPTTY